MKDRGGYRNISRDWIHVLGKGLALTFFAGILKYGNSRALQGENAWKGKCKCKKKIKYVCTLLRKRMRRGWMSMK